MTIRRLVAFLVFVVTLVSMGCTSLPPPNDFLDAEHTNPELARAVLGKILNLQDLAEKNLVDEYGFYLPKDEGAFVDQGDAFYHQAYHIVVFCQQTEAWRLKLTVEGEPIFDDPRNDKTKQTKNAWAALKSAQDPDGRIFRHPMEKYRLGTTNSGSISHDVLSALYYLAAEVKYRDCKPVADEMGDYLLQFAHYAVRHSGELGVGNTSPMTQLRDWLPLHHMLLLYGKPSPIDQFRLTASEKITHIFPQQIKAANDMWSQKFDCKFKPDSNFPYCETISTTSVHLLWLRTTAFMVLAHMNPEHALYSRSRTEYFLKTLASLGSDRRIDKRVPYVLPPWAAYRNYKGKSVMRVLHELNSWPAGGLPSEDPTMSLGVWGCTEYVWNNLPQEKCGWEKGKPASLRTALSWEVPFFAALARPIR